MNTHNTATDKNPLTLLALAGLFALGKCVWHAIGTHTVGVFDIVDFATWSVFLILYAKRHPLAWFVSLVLFAVITPLDLLVSQSRLTSYSTRIEVKAITAVICLGFIVYVLFLRTKYQRYLAQREAGRGN
jgi:hypothetical protein